MGDAGGQAAEGRRVAAHGIAVAVGDAKGVLERTEHCRALSETRGGVGSSAETPRRRWSSTETPREEGRPDGGRSMVTCRSGRNGPQERWMAREKSR